MTMLNKSLALGRRLVSDPQLLSKVASVANSAVTVVRHDPRSLKHLRPWLRSLLPHHTTVSDEVPWVNFDAIAWLQRWLKPSMQVFEYGSGGSSIFFARRVAQVHSIEHDAGFHEFLTGVVSQRGIDNLRVDLVPPHDDGQPTDYGNRNFRSFSKGFETSSFEDYVTSIDAYEDETFDLIVVDGRARASCLVRAMHKVRSGGYILLDNSEREPYALGVGELLTNGFVETRFRSLGPCNTYVWETSIFQRP